MVRNMLQNKLERILFLSLIKDPIFHYFLRFLLSWYEERPKINLKIFEKKIIKQVTLSPVLCPKCHKNCNKILSKILSS